MVEMGSKGGMNVALMCSGLNKLKDELIFLLKCCSDILYLLANGVHLNNFEVPLIFRSVLGCLC